MTGTFVNTGAIVMGSLIGLAGGRHLSSRLKTLLMQTLGLSTLLIGLQMALSVNDLIPGIACLLLGAITGEILKIEDGMEGIGEWLKVRTRSKSSTFVEGFVTTSLLYCTGAMVIVGSIQDGTTGNPSTLLVKAMLDGVASIAFASTFGIGVAFSAISVLLIQGTITLLAANITFLQEPAVLASVTSTGGILIVAISVNLLSIARIPIGNLLPALFYAVAWTLI